MGQNVLSIESGITWATPSSFTVLNYPCWEDGKNCRTTHHYIDPSNDIEAVQRRLEKHSAKIGR
jgi:hypothetical protein